MQENLLSKPYLLSADDLNDSDIYKIFSQAKYFMNDFKPGKKYDYLKGKTVALAFFEPSTRTRLSFELAAKRLSADTFSFASTTSSLTKGESLLDTLRTIECMNVQMYIVRHGCSGASVFLQENTPNPVINAGDGKHEHPTQALLDSFTLYRHFGKVEGLKICIIGDILHSRVARSNITMLNTLKAEVALFGPGTLLPPAINKWNLNLLSSIDEAVEWADVLLCLRLQHERMESGLLPSIREYSSYFGINEKHISAKPGLVIMHPGPVNYGVELDYNLATYPNVLIQNQVIHGVFTRMALLALLSGTIN